MLNLSRRTEYGLMALGHLSTLPPGNLAKVGEISSSARLPHELLAKILSELVKAGLAESYAGPGGGFRLARPASSVSLADVIRVLESKPNMTECLSDPEKCNRTSACSIRGPIAKVNHRVTRILEETPLSDLFQNKRTKISATNKLEDIKI